MKSKMVTLVYRKKNTNRVEKLSLEVDSDLTVNVGIGVVPLKELSSWFYLFYGHQYDLLEIQLK